MTKTEFLEKLTSARSEWDALLAKMDLARMSQPGVEGNWSIKDIIAHVTWYEREMINLIRTRTLAGSNLWDSPVDQRNAAIYEQNRARPLADMLAESQAAYQQFLGAVQTLSDDELNAASRFKDMPLDWVPWEVIASNSFNHYPDHIATIRRWLAA